MEISAILHQLFLSRSNQDCIWRTARCGAFVQMKPCCIHHSRRMQTQTRGLRCCINPSTAVTHNEKSVLTTLRCVGLLAFTLKTFGPCLRRLSSRIPTRTELTEDRVHNAVVAPKSYRRKTRPSLNYPLKSFFLVVRYTRVTMPLQACNHSLHAGPKAKQVFSKVPVKFDQSCNDTASLSVPSVLLCVLLLHFSRFDVWHERALKTYTTQFPSPFTAIAGATYKNNVSITGKKKRVSVRETRQLFKPVFNQPWLLGGS